MLKFIEARISEFDITVLLRKKKAQVKLGEGKLKLDLTIQVCQLRRKVLKNKIRRYDIKLSAGFDQAFMLHLVSAEPGQIATL